MFHAQEKPASGAPELATDNIATTGGLAAATGVYVEKLQYWLRLDDAPQPLYAPFIAHKVYDIARVREFLLSKGVVK